MNDQQMPVSKTARDIIAKLHPAIKEEWRVKLLKVEHESIRDYARRHGLDAEELDAEELHPNAEWNAAGYS